VMLRRARHDITASSRPPLSTHMDLSHQNIPGGRWSDLAVASQLEAAQVQCVQSSLHETKTGSSGACAQGVQDCRQTLRQKSQNPELPNVEQIKRHDAVEVLRSRGQPVDGA